MPELWESKFYMLTEVMSNLCLCILNINKEARKQVWFVNTGDAYSTWSINKKALRESEFDLFLEMMPTLCLSTISINKDTLCESKYWYVHISDGNPYLSTLN